MRPLPSCSARVLKTLLLLLLLTVFAMYRTIETMFNMTGHRHWPKFSTRVWGTGDKDKHFSVYNHRTLVDATESVNVSRERGNNNYSVKHSILWYNKPEWISLRYANDAMSSVCYYRNCFMTDDSRVNIQNHSAIVFTMTERNDYSPPVRRVDRRPDQVWIFFSLESPINYYHIWHRHTNWLNTMNWSMSYRTDSDIFYPYGILHTLQPGEKLVQSDVFSRKSKHAAWIVSHCGADSMRDEYVQEMIYYGLKVDIYGRCSGSKFKEDMSQLKRTIEQDYKFYLSFENSLCMDYITEKFFHYFQWEVVLVTRGGANYSRLLPDNTYIDTAWFPSAEELVEYLLLIADSEDKYLGYLNEKAKYSFIEYGPSPYCSICAKLNRLEENRKSYSDHVTYIHKNMCWAPNDLSKFHISVIMYALLGCFTTICILICVWKWCQYLKHR